MNHMATAAILERISSRDTAAAADMDQSASDIAAAVIHEVSMSLHWSEHVSVTPAGHYLKLDLTDEGRRYLGERIASMVRGQLASHRGAGEAQALKDRMAWSAL